MKTLKLIFAIIFIFFFIVQCSKDEDDGVHVAPRIEWIPTDTTTTFTYTGGVVSGYYFFTDFEVLNNSGQICIDISNEGATGTGCNTTINVEQGKKYHVCVKGKPLGTTLAFEGEYCLSIVFCSINCAENYSIPVESFFVPGDQVITEDHYSCAQRINLSDISVTEL